MKSKTFAQKVYEKLREVPKGKVTTYHDLAHSINSQAYQAVGNAMRNNPNPPFIPCHRCVKSNGLIGGFGGETEGPNIKKKISMLRKEGVKVKDNKINLKKYLHKF